MGIFKKEIILRPNCLLTRYPICFVKGRTNPPHFLNCWNGLTDFIRAHGYEVIEFTLPWRDSPEHRENYLTRKIETIIKTKGGIHLATRSEANLVLIDFLKKKDAVGVRSLTFLGNEIHNSHEIMTSTPTFTQLRSNLDLKEQRERFLDHCIFLAEQDFLAAK